MKKLYSMLFALLALGLVSNVDARCRTRCAKRSCVKRCDAPCAPKTQCSVKETVVYEPCEKVIRVKGVCPHTICERTCTTLTKSKRCTGPCQVSCPSAVNPEDRGGANAEAEANMVSEEESYGG